MALIECEECAKQISDKASACPECGNPAPGGTSVTDDTGTYCSRCKTQVHPVVTNVGGGSCSVGSREKWKCPRCKETLHTSGCFVATASYGDEDAVEVRFLRGFRDEILNYNVPGRLLIKGYYACSPYLAKVVELSPSLGRVCRRCLDIVVSQIERHTNLRRSHFRRSSNDD